MPNTQIETGQWIECSKELPPEREIVETKIDDFEGCRNEGRLFRQGTLWFVEDGAMYVYYRPTHWRSDSRDAATKLRDTRANALGKLSHDEIAALGLKLEAEGTL